MEDGYDLSILAIINYKNLKRPRWGACLLSQHSGAEAGKLSRPVWSTL